MTEVEKVRFREIYQRLQIGYKIAETERDHRIRTTTTAEGIRSLRKAFQLAATSQPPRPSSGLVQFYEALKKSR